MSSQAVQTRSGRGSQSSEVIPPGSDGEETPPVSSRTRGKARVGDFSQEGRHVSFQTPPDTGNEATSSATPDLTSDGSAAHVDTEITEHSTKEGSPVSTGSHWGTPWSQLPDDMIFRFASDSQQSVRGEAAADTELLSLADQVDEESQTSSPRPVSSSEPRFSFAEPPPGALRGGQSIIPPGRRARGPLQQLRTSTESQQATTDLYILDKDWSAWYAASQAFGDTWKKSRVTPTSGPKDIKSSTGNCISGRSFVSQKTSYGMSSGRIMNGSVIWAMTGYV